MAQEDEIAASRNEQVAARTQVQATADTKCAADKPDHEDTERTLAVDQVYLSEGDVWMLLAYSSGDALSSCCSLGFASLVSSAFYLTLSSHKDSEP